MLKKITAVLLLPLFSGCATDIHVKRARVESFGPTGFVIAVEVDEDLDSEEWARATPSFRFVVLDDTRLSAIRRTLPETPEYIERAGPVLEEDWREQFIVMGWIEETWAPERIAEDGGIRHGVPVGPGRWSYRIEVPYTLQLDWRDPDEGEFEETRDCYRMIKGQEFQVWGRVVGVEYMLCPWYESDLVRLSVHRPR